MREIILNTGKVIACEVKLGNKNRKKIVECRVIMHQKRKWLSSSATVLIMFWNEQSSILKEMKAKANTIRLEKSCCTCS